MIDLESKIKSIEKKNVNLTDKLQGALKESKALKLENDDLKDKVAQGDSKLKHIMEKLATILASIPSNAKHSACETNEIEAEAEGKSCSTSRLRPGSKLERKFGRLLGNNSKLLGEEDENNMTKLKEFVNIKEKTLNSANSRLQEIKCEIEALLK